MDCLNCGLEFEVEHEYSYEKDGVEVLYCPFCGAEMEGEEPINMFGDDE